MPSSGSSVEFNHFQNFMENGCLHHFKRKPGNFLLPVILIILLFLIPGRIVSQRILTLRECYERAEEAAPIAAEKKVYGEIWQLKDVNLSRGWLPTLDGNGQLVYNSSVVDLSEVMGALPVPGIGQLIKTLPHEQYKVTLEVNQMIYDGGALRGARELEKAGLEVQDKQTEADLYKLRGQINGYFFNLLLLDRQRELLDNYLGIIGKRLSSMNAALENGVLLPSDIDVLTSEKLKLEQQLTENGIRRAAFLKILSDIVGNPIEANAVLVLPFAGEMLSGELTRPELALFDLKKEQLEVSLKVLQSRRKPRAFGFATLGYGNPPGSNFFRDEFAPFYIVGAGVKWNFFDWNKTRNEKQVVALQQSVLEGRKQELADNLRRAMEAKKAEISSLEKLLETDAGLIELKKRITAATESQYANGTITATDYLRELNAEQEILINHEIHKISLVMARVEYLNFSGKEIE